MLVARFALAALTLLAASAPAGAGAPPPACDAGRFVVQGNPLRERVGIAPPDRIVIANGAVEIASVAGAASAKVRATARGTLVRARFPGAQLENDLAAWSWNVLASMNRTLGGAPFRIPPLRFKARIGPDCAVMEGSLRGGRERLRRSFTALAEMTAPHACLTVWVPVCGDDGVTYSNACYAAQAGAEVAYEGECGAECGTIVGIPCGAGEFCEMPDDTCSSADLGGTCVAIPEACTHQYDPVCGCDGVTYPNDCERRAALVNEAHAGACAR